MKCSDGCIEVFLVVIAIIGVNGWVVPMTKKRLFIVIGLLTALLSVGFVVALMLPDDRPGVTKANFDRIQDSMTWEQVQGLLGDKVVFAKGRLWGWTVVWREDDGATVVVTFSRDGRVANKEWRSSVTVNLGEFLRWLAP